MASISTNVGFKNGSTFSADVAAHGMLITMSNEYKLSYREMSWTHCKDTFRFHFDTPDEARQFISAIAALVVVDDQPDGEQGSGRDADVVEEVRP